MAKTAANAPCACHSGLKYKRCCGPLHRGKKPVDPLALMRSRYCAYAIGLYDYVIQTTDPTGPHWQYDQAAWNRELESFGAATQFRGLMICDYELDEEVAWVTFDAQLEQHGRGVRMIEKSLFRRVDDRWLYHSGMDPNGH